MPDRRSVNELSVEELEEILAIRKHEAREARLKRLRAEGRVLDVPDTVSALSDQSTMPDGSAVASVRRSKFSEVYEDDHAQRRFVPSPADLAQVARSIAAADRSRRSRRPGVDLHQRAASAHRNESNRRRRAARPCRPPCRRR